MTNEQQTFMTLGAWVLDTYFAHECDNIDGGDPYRHLTGLGIFETVTVLKPCDPEYCACCDEYGLDTPTECIRLTQDIQKPKQAILANG